METREERAVIEGTTMDICRDCGKKVKENLWGGKCSCGGTGVHQGECSICSALIGYIIGDDYCGPEVLICPRCMKKLVEKKS